MTSDANNSCTVGKWRARVSAIQKWKLSDGNKYRLIPASISGTDTEDEFYIVRRCERLGKALVVVRKGDSHRRVSVMRRDSWRWSFAICGRTAEELDSNLLRILEGYTGLSVVSRPDGTLYESTCLSITGNPSCGFLTEDISWGMSDRSACLLSVMDRTKEGILAEDTDQRFGVFHRGISVLRISSPLRGGEHEIGIPVPDTKFSKVPEEEVSASICKALEVRTGLKVISHPTKQPYISRRMTIVTPTSAQIPELVLQLIECLEKDGKSRPVPAAATTTGDPPLLLPRKRREVGVRPPLLVLDTTVADEDGLMQEMRMAREQERRDAMRSLSVQTCQQLACRGNCSLILVDPDSDRIHALCCSGKCELRFHMTCFKKSGIQLHSACCCGAAISAIHRWRRGRRVHSEIAAAVAAEIPTELPSDMPVQTSNGCGGDTNVPVQTEVIDASPPPPGIPLPSPPAAVTSIHRPAVPMLPRQATASEPRRWRARRRQGNPRMSSAVNIIDLRREFEKAELGNREL